MINFSNRKAFLRSNTINLSKEAPEILTESSNLIGAYLLHLLPKLNFTNIGIYSPIGNEVDFTSIFKKSLPFDVNFSLPWIKNNNQMSYFLISKDINFDKLKTQKPKNDNFLNPDLIIVPIHHGFNRAKFRLGRGGGHFDKYLKRNKKTTTIGLAYSILEINENFQEKLDIPLNYIITEKKIIF